MHIIRKRQTTKCPNYHGVGVVLRVKKTERANIKFNVYSFFPNIVAEMSPNIVAEMSPNLTDGAESNLVTFACHKR